MPIYLIVLQGLVALGFAAAGLAKLFGAKPIADQFREFGLPKSAMYMVGILEVAGAGGIFFRSLGVLAAVGLAGLMIGAIGNHLKVHHPFSKFAPSAVLLVLSLGLAYFLAKQGFWIPFLDTNN